MDEVLSNLGFWIQVGVILLVLWLFIGSLFAKVKPYLLFFWYLVFPPSLDYAYEGGYDDEDDDDRNGTGGEWRPAPAPQSMYAPVVIPQRALVVPHAEWWPIVTRQAKHVRLIAPTDAGKSVTAQAMLGELPGKLLIIDPLWKPGNWGGLPAVTVTPEGDYAPIAAALAALLDEMRARGAMLQNLAPGQELPVDDLIVLWDEVPDTITELAKKHNDLAGEVIRRIAQRGRHGKIKLIGMGQSDRVAAWGLQGYGDAAQNFATVYLMDKALEKRPDLLDKVERPAVLEWRGKLMPVDVSRLLPLSQRPISPSRVFQFTPTGESFDDGYVATGKRTTCTAEDVAAYLEANPGSSQRKVEIGLFGYAGGDAYKQVGRVWGEALLLLRQNEAA